MENDAPVVGPAARTADSKTVKLEHGELDAQATPAAADGLDKDLSPVTTR